MSERWTPGPWIVDQRQIIAPKGSESRGGLVATCRGTAQTRTIANANARLIAAAPELYEALAELDEAYCRAGGDLTREERLEDTKRLINARAALAKARGEK